MSSEKKYLGAEIPEDLFNNFCSQVVARKSKKKFVLEKAIQLWVSLPEEVRISLVNGENIKDIIDEVYRGLLTLHMKAIKQKLESIASEDQAHTGGKTSKIPIQEIRSRSADKVHQG